MSEENVEVVRRQWDLWSSGDVEAATEHFHPDVVVIAPEEWPEGPRFEGIEAWKTQAKRLRETWKQARIEIDEIEAVGGDRVLGRFRYVTQGRDEEMTFETPMSALFVLEDRRIRRAQFFWDPGEARAAAGLRD